jgi:hypothetical protein
LGESDSTDNAGIEASPEQKRLVHDPISRFFQAVRVGDMKVLRDEYANAGASINIQQPGTKASALHYAAGVRSRRVLLWLGQFKDLDYLLQDCEGRLPSAVAYEVADDPVIGRYLTKKENEQARARGIDIRALLTS